MDGCTASGHKSTFLIVILRVAIVILSEAKTGVAFTNAFENRQQ
jgi:hypothetical protein